MSSLLETFREILAQHDLLPEDILADGNLYRCPTRNKPYKRNGAYIAHQDRPATLWWCNWETGDQGTFHAEGERALSPVELWHGTGGSRPCGNSVTKNAPGVMQRRRSRHTSVYRHPFPVQSGTPAYLSRKGIPALADMRQDRNGMLLIPVRDSSGRVQSLQYIAPDGTKRFLTGGKVQGGQFVIPGKAEKPLALCEGYATGASIHLACAWTVYVTFSAGNLPVVAAAVRKQFPDAQILICGDNDETGRDKGQEAAQAAQAHLVVPHFTTGSGKDFNDLHLTEGLQSVRWQLENALPDTPPSLVSLDMGEFLSMSIPERGYLLSPILPVQGIGILYAPRGIGKTFAALSVAVAVASGGAVFNWRAPMPKRTLYVDGEMPATAMQHRLAALVSGMSVPPHTLKNMALITPDLQPCPMPDLSTAQGRSCWNHS